MANAQGFRFGWLAQRCWGQAVAIPHESAARLEGIAHLINRCH
jgi:hypothetical protein